MLGEQQQLSGDLKAMKLATVPPLPAGWAEARDPTGAVYYFEAATGATSWERPAGGGGAQANEAAAKNARLSQVQSALREECKDARSLSITLFLTGCKADDIKPSAGSKPGSTSELVTALQSTTDPAGKPYLTIKAGRPNWDTEFKSLSDRYGKCELGVCFCGAPMIAQALLNYNAINYSSKFDFLEFCRPY